MGAYDKLLDLVAEEVGLSIKQIKEMSPEKLRTFVQKNVTKNDKQERAIQI